MRTFPLVFPLCIQRDPISKHLEGNPPFLPQRRKATSCRRALKINTGTEMVHFSFHFTNKEKVFKKMFVLLKVSPGPKLNASAGLPVIHLNKSPFRFLCFSFLSGNLSADS